MATDKEQLIKDLEKKFKAIRYRGYGGDRSETMPLLYILGYDDHRTAKQIEALLIKFVDKLIPNKRDKDILLMAFRLLKGYDNDEMLELESRRKKYVHESHFLTAKEKETYETGNEVKREEILETACTRLRKSNEDALF